MAQNTSKKQELEKLRDDKQAELRATRLDTLRKKAAIKGESLWRQCKKAAADGESRLLVHEVKSVYAEEQQLLLEYIEQELGLSTKVERIDNSDSSDPQDYSYLEYLYIVW